MHKNDLHPTNAKHLRFVIVFQVNLKQSSQFKLHEIVFTSTQLIAFQSLYFTLKTMTLDTNKCDKPTFKL